MTLLLLIFALVSPGEVRWASPFTEECKASQERILREGVALYEYVEGRDPRRLTEVIRLRHTYHPRNRKLRIRPAVIDGCVRDYVVLSRRTKTPLFRFRLEPTGERTEIRFSLDLKIPPCGG